MHFEVLVEDQSGGKALDILIPKIIGEQDTFKIRFYKGRGDIPKNLTDPVSAKNKLLLSNLPKLLRGYGRTFPIHSADAAATIILVCDLDDKCLKAFRTELFNVLNSCSPKPQTRFCFAIEEGEAWLLGDIPAIEKAYPKAKKGVLNGYVNDSICGTWEVLANAVFAGGAAKLKNGGYQATGREKYLWAEKITPHMNIDANKSPSFCYFRDTIRALAEMPRRDEG